MLAQGTLRREHLMVERALRDASLVSPAEALGVSAELLVLGPGPLEARWPGLVWKAALTLVARLAPGVLLFLGLGPLRASAG